MKDRKKKKNIRKTKYIGHKKNIENINDNNITRQNDRISNDKNQDNQYAIIKIVINKITNIINLINKIFSEILIYFFDFLLSRLNPPPNIFTGYNLLLNISFIYIDQSFLHILLPYTPIVNYFDIKFKFFFLLFC